MSSRTAALLATLVTLCLILLLPPALWPGVQASPQQQGVDTTPEATPAATLDLGDNVERAEGILRLLSPFRYRFEAEAGEVLTLIARDPSGALDPTLRLLDPSGEVVAENEDHGSTFPGLDANDAMIDGVEVETGGEYIAEVSSTFQTEDTIELFIVHGDSTALSERLAAEATAEPPRGYRLYGPCTVTVDFISARVRSGPTLNAEQVGAILPGEVIPVIGRVTDSLGFTWYRLNNFNWVRSDAVIAEGACRQVTTY